MRGGCKKRTNENEKENEREREGLRTRGVAVRNAVAEEREKMDEGMNAREECENEGGYKRGKLRRDE